MPSTYLSLLLIYLLRPLKIKFLLKKLSEAHFLCLKTPIIGLELDEKDIIKAAAANVCGSLI